MGRLIRLDGSGHTTLAEWNADNEAAQRAAQEEFDRELEAGMLASVTSPEGAEVVRHLPLDAELVVLRRPIAGG
jgi:hypothetical protein